MAERPDGQRADEQGDHAVSQPTVVLDPTAGTTPSDRTRSHRPPSLVGVTVGLLDINKPRGDVFLDRVAERLGEQGATVLRYPCLLYTSPSPRDS